LYNGKNTILEKGKFFFTKAEYTFLFLQSDWWDQRFKRLRIMVLIQLT